MTMPSSWEQTTFGQVIRVIRNGYNAPQNKDGDGVAITRIETIATGEIDLGRVGYGHGMPAEFRLTEGDILFSHINSGKHIGKTAIVFAEHGALYHGINLLRLQLEAGVDPKFFEAQCRLMRLEGIFSLRAQHAVNQASLNQGAIKSFGIKMAPLPEQRRIVAKIDSLNCKSRRVRDHLDHIPRLVEKYKQAVLAAAFRGDLTRQCSTERSQWVHAELAHVCDPRRPITYGVIKLGNEVPGGVPCLRTSNVRWLRIDVQGLKSISKTLSDEYHRTILSGDEVLVNVRGTLGGVAVVPASMSGWNVSREVAVAPVDSRLVLPKYAAHWIAASRSQQWLTRVEKGVAYTGINLEDLRKLPISYPPIDEQEQIVHRVEAAFAWIDRLSAEATSGHKLIDRLDQAILAKAFRGELVPQDPVDEPASVLLERIKAERDDALKQKRCGKG